MANLPKGPYTVEFGDNVLAGIEDVKPDYSVASNDVSTVQGRTYTIKGSHKASLSLTFLENDVAALKVVLPQYYVANGGTASTGETVTSSDGIIDIVPGQEISDTKSVIVTSANGHVFRLVDASTEIESVDFPDDSVRRVVVTFTGETDASVATIQFFKEGALGAIS